MPVAIGGLILLGFYQVLSVIDGNNFTITAASAATSGAGPAGAVPQFIATAGSTTITVNLTAHGLLAGQTFNVQVATTVGGLVLSGAYVIVTASANSFTFAAATAAGANGTVSENAGLAQLAGQVMTADPLDRTLTPVSSTDYDAFPDKIQQAPPTNYWFNRQASIPQISPWPVPDANGPYVFQGHRMRKIQDANILASETADLPDRFLDAYCADLTYRLAVKWKPALADARKLDRDEAWGEASRDDSERVPTYLRPDMSAYFR